MRRRGVRGALPSTFELNLTPLLDVVLQLITFFMMLVHFATKIEGSTDIPLPVSPLALPSSDPGLDRLVVAVDRSGALVQEERTLAGDEAGRWWAEQASKRRRDRSAEAELDTRVIVRADRSTSYGAIRHVLEQAQKVGFSRFSLVVLRDEGR